MDPNFNNYNNFAGLSQGDSAPMQYLNRGMNETRGLYNPYLQYANNPEESVNRIYGTFQDSPLYQRAREQKLKGLTSAAAASGRINNPAYEQEYGDLGAQLLIDQMRQYYGDVMGERDLGFRASQGLAGDVGNMYGSGSTLAAQKDLEKQKQKNDLISSLIQGVGTIGGAAIGGPLGGALGNALGQGLNKWMGY